MPIYEYECRGCGRRFEQLIIHSTHPECPGCQGHDLERLISLFAVDSESTRSTALQAGKKRQANVTREHQAAEIAYHKEHGHH